MITFKKGEDNEQKKNVVFFFFAQGLSIQTWLAEAHDVNQASL